MVVDPVSLALISGAVGWFAKRKKDKCKETVVASPFFGAPRQPEQDYPKSVVNYSQTVNEYSGRASQPPAYSDGGYGGGGHSSGAYYGGDRKYMEEEDDDDDDEIPDGYMGCDVCSDGFPKNQLHYNCIVCNDGNFDICQVCRDRGHSCPSGHRLYQRRLGLDDDDDDEDDENLECDICAKEFPKHHAHYHCIICNDGHFDICQVCKDRRHGCPGGHGLYKRRLE